MKTKITGLDEKTNLTPTFTGGTSKAYYPIKPGNYTAHLVSLTEETYRAKYRGIPGYGEDGKWTYVKLIPEIVLIDHPNATKISNQDFTLCLLDAKGNPTRPEAPDENPLWSPGAYLLKALGLIKQTGATAELDYTPELVVNRVLTVKVDLAGYIRGTANFNPEQLRKEVGATTPDEVLDLVSRYNLDRADEGKIRLKNYIIGTFPVFPSKIAEKGYYLNEPTGQVFLSETHYEAYCRNLQDAATPSDGW